MPLDSGVLTVWRGVNQAPAGSMPDIEHIEHWSSYYEARTVGITRYWSAMQAGDRSDMMVRVQRHYDISTGTDVVRVEPFTHTDGDVYKIIQIQQVEDADGLPMTDLTLERMEGPDAEQIKRRIGIAD